MTGNEVLIKTPEEAIETIKSNMPISGYQMLRESLNMAIEALKEVQYYRGIGTVEECREAVKKQKAREPRDIEHDYSYFVCDNCGEWIYVSDDFKSHHYCLNCGQAIQWENLEGMEDE